MSIRSKRVLPAIQPTILRQGLTLAASLGVAEVFYHFHSFSLECLAFLATWKALDWTSERPIGWTRQGR